MDFETIYQALFARLEATFSGWDSTREFLIFDQVQDWPLLMVNASEMDAIQSDADPVPARWLLRARVTLYLDRSDASTPFETSILSAVAQVVDALKPQAGEASVGASYHTTLGDLVERAWVHGTVEVYRRLDPSDRAMVLIPIEMYLTQ
jgi:hypothetical protein